VNRAAVHAIVLSALDAVLDAVDEYRRAPVEDELVRLRDVDLEARAKADLVRERKLRTVKIGREVWTRRSWVLAAVEALPVATPVAADDDLAVAARKRALRRSA
jgi:hypothetical protein